MNKVLLGTVLVIAACGAADAMDAMMGTPDAGAQSGSSTFADYTCDRSYVIDHGSQEVTHYYALVDVGDAHPSRVWVHADLRPTYGHAVCPLTATCSGERIADPMSNHFQPSQYVDGFAIIGCGSSTDYDQEIHTIPDADNRRFVGDAFTVEILP